MTKEIVSKEVLNWQLFELRQELRLGADQVIIERAMRIYLRKRLLGPEIYMTNPNQFATTNICYPVNPFSD